MMDDFGFVEIISDVVWCWDKSVVVSRIISDEWRLENLWWEDYGNRVVVCVWEKILWRIGIEMDVGCVNDDLNC